ncbi:MAG: hypothetical protein FGM35_00325 [Rhodocyclaceae bacterium]|nr:hypothetical protein [Rhodocyclaceae bacterium]
MNLRIAPEHIRFRISAEEFVTLLTHGALSNGTSFGNAECFYYGIRSHPSATDREGFTLALATYAEEGLTRYMLTVFADGIAQLHSGLAGKDGIQEHLTFENGDMLTIGLEIDLHSKKGTGRT